MRLMVEPDVIYPLTPLQHGMLFHSLAAPSSGVDIEQMLCDLPEAIDPVALRRGWDQVMARHDVLRTSFRWIGVPEPQQEVARAITLPWTQLDWRETDATEQQSRLNAFLAADRALGFDLAQRPLFRLTLIQLATTHWKLVWTFHHAILDGRSLAPLVEEVFAFYAAAQRNEELKLPPPRAFREHAEWLRRQDHARAESFWRGELQGFTAPTPLTVDHKASPLRTNHEGIPRVARRLSVPTTEGLRYFAQANGVNLGTLVQAAWALLLSRYSSQRDIVFGVTRACRRSALTDNEATIGIFINTLPLRLDVDADRTLVEWLRDVRFRWNSLRAHEQTPLAQVQAWSQVPPGLPLFESLVVFENHTLEEKLRSLGGAWPTRSFDLIEQTNFPLTLAAYGGAQLELKLQFDRRRFDAATVNRMIGHLERLLTAMPDSGARRLRDLPLITVAEQDELLTHCGTRAAEFAPDATLVSWFERQVAATPNRIAVVCDEHGTRSELTYAELNRRAEHLARQIAQHAIGPDTLVGLFLDRSVELIVGILGILKAGAAYVPIDPSSPSERIAFMIADASMPVIVTQRTLLAKLPPHGAAVVCVGDLQATGGPLRPAPTVVPDNLAYVIYTSGSTGQPKGTLITHHNVVRLFRGAERLFDFNADDVWTLFHSSAFDFSVWEIWGALLYGGKLVIVPWLASRSPENFRMLLASERVTVLNQTPSAFRQLIHADAAASRRDDLALRIVIFGGEALELKSLAPWFARHGDQRPRLVNMYGITETTVHVTYRALTAADIDSGSVIGTPLPDLQLYLLDEELRPAPLGVPGELFVSGDGLARGYLNRPELTAERFLPNPFLAGTRLYRTGDRARWLPNHDLEYLGRRDQQVKIRGFRIELGEIETALSRHPAVRDAVVIARDDDGERRLVAYLVPAKSEAQLGDLRAYLQPHLPDYMIPSAFVPLDRLPLTENGKLDRRALPAPELQRPELGTPYVAPNTPAEHALTAAWQQVLHVKQVGMNDSFFSLGGNSLQLVQLLGFMGAAFTKPVTIADLFQYPTVRSLAAHLEQPIAPSRLGAAQERAQRQLAALKRLDPIVAITSKP